MALARLDSARQLHHLLVSEQVRGYILQRNPLAMGDKLRFGGSRECLRLWRRDVEILIGASLRRWRQRLQQSLSSSRSFSRATMRNIRENLFFAFLYNALGIPVAAGVLYPFFGLLLSPIIARAAMSLRSVSVISNALRLRKTRL